MFVMHKLGRATAMAGWRWIDERCASMAAAVAFFAAFSLAPTLVIVLAIGGAFFGPEAVRGQLVGQLRGLIGEDGALAVQGLIQSAWLADSSMLKTLLSVGTLLVGASAVFSELSEDVNLLWKVPPSPGANPVGAFLRVRLLSIGLVVGVGFLMVVSLVLDAVVTAMQDMLWPPDAAIRMLMILVNQASSLLLLWAVFALLMKAMPRARVRGREVVLGAGRRLGAVCGRQEPLRAVPGPCRNSRCVRRGRFARGTADVAVLLGLGVPVWGGVRAGVERGGRGGGACGGCGGRKRSVGYAMIGSSEGWQSGRMRRS